MSRVRSDCHGKSISVGVFDNSISKLLDSRQQISVVLRIFKQAGRHSDKTFQYAGGKCAPAEETMYLPFELRESIKEICTYSAINRAPSAKHKQTRRLDT